MPVTNETSLAGPFLPNGSTTIFTFAFNAQLASDVAVFDGDGAQVSSALYTVALYEGDGGTVTFTVAPTALQYPELFIALVPSFAQTADFTNAGPSYNPVQLTAALDALASRIIAVKGEADRSFKAPRGESLAAVPNEATRAGRFLAFDAGGDPVVANGTGADGSFRADVAASTGSALIGTIASGSGAVARPLSAKLQDYAVTPFDYMDAVTQVKVALRTATAADAPAISEAIADAMAAHDAVEFPEGLYQTNAPIALTRTGQAITGRGSRRVEVRINSTTAKAFTLANGVADYTVRGFKVTRAGTPVAGAGGLECLGTTDNSLIEDVWCEGHWTGMVLGTCDTGRVQNVRCNKNLEDGLYQANASTYGPSQWEMFDILCDRNGRDGWRVQVVDGPAGLILGNTTSIKTFANSGWGCNFIGSATTPIFDVRMEQAFLGSDGLGSVRLNTFGGKHRLCGFFERNGRDPTGPTLATPASNNGVGIEITANNIDVTIYGSTIDDNALDGILHSGGTLIVGSNMIFNNGQALTASRRNGILSEGGELVATGNGINNLSGNTSQLFGIATAHDDVVINGNSLKGNTTGGATTGGTADAIVFANSPTALPMLLAPTVQVLRFNSAFDAAATGGDQGVGTINVSTDLFKNGVAYANP